MGDRGAGFEPLLPFTRDSEDFTLGVEVGRLWELTKSDADEIVEYVHAANAEMVLRIGEATGRFVQSEELGDGWLEVTFGSRW